MPSREPYRVESSIADLVLFTKSSIWRDQATVIDYHIEHFRDQLEDPMQDRGKDAESDDILRGRLRMLRDLRAMPRDLALSKKMQIEEEMESEETHEEQPEDLDDEA